MPDRIELQRIWDRTHRQNPASEKPEANTVAFAECLQKQLPPGAHLLDAGCGCGRNALYFSRLGFSVCGCDVSPVALLTARDRIQPADFPIHFQVADLTCLPYPDHFFAAAVCVHVLPYHRKADIARGIRELWRVIRPNGWLYVDFLDCDDADYGCGPKLEEHTFLDPDGAPIHFSSRQEISELMDGFALEHATRGELKSSPARTRVIWGVWATRSGTQDRVSLDLGPRRMTR